MFKRSCALAAALWFGCVPARAQDTPPAPSAPAVLPSEPATAPLPHLPAGTVVHIKLLKPLSSKTNKRGDTFEIELAEPIVAAEGVLVPAGATGRGEVISASHKGMGGQAGELVLAARYIDFGSQRIPLRAFKMSGTGGDATNGMNWCKAIFVYCSNGASELEIPAGFAADAKLAADLSLPVVAPAPVQDQPAEDK